MKPEAAARTTDPQGSCQVASGCLGDDWRPETEACWCVHYYFLNGHPMWRKTDNRCCLGGSLLVTFEDFIWVGKAVWICIPASPLFRLQEEYPVVAYFMLQTLKWVGLNLLCFTLWLLGYLFIYFKLSFDTTAPGQVADTVERSTLGREKKRRRHCLCAYSSPSPNMMTRPETLQAATFGD